jgi:hypothetical protein
MASQTQVKVSRRPQGVDSKGPIDKRTSKGHVLPF